MDEESRNVQTQFGATAEAYVASSTHSTGADLARIGELAADLPRRQRAVDVATGGGHTARAIAPFYESLILLDITVPMLRAASRALRESGIHPVGAIQADAEALPLASESVDLLTCRLAPHHFPQPARFVHEVARVLRPGGRFILVDSTVAADESLATWLHRLDKTRDPTHGRTLPAVEWLDIVSDTRLAIQGHTLYPQRHPLQEWLDRAKVNAAGREAIDRMLREATPAIREAFHIEFAPDGTPVAFTDEKLLLWADKRSRA